MDWNSLLSAIAIIVFIVLMMRGCGGMMAGGTPATQWRRQRRQIASREPVELSSRLMCLTERPLVVTLSSKDA